MRESADGVVWGLGFGGCDGVGWIDGWDEHIVIFADSGEEIACGF